MIQEFEHIRAQNYYGISDELFCKVRDSVNLVEGNIVVVNEIKKFNPETINIEFDQLEALVEGLDSFSHIILLDGCERPDAKTRQVIIERFSKIVDRVNHVSYCVGKNLMIRTSINFVMYASGIENFSITKTEEMALQNCRIENSKKLSLIK